MFSRLWRSSLRCFSFVGEKKPTGPTMLNEPGRKWSQYRGKWSQKRKRLEFWWPHLCPCIQLCLKLIVHHLDFSVMWTNKFPFLFKLLWVGFLWLEIESWLITVVSSNETWHVQVIKLEAKAALKLFSKGITEIENNTLQKHKTYWYKTSSEICCIQYGSPIKENLHS